MFVFKSKVPAIFPQAEAIRDEEVKKFGQDMAKTQTETARSVLDDMKMLEKVQTADSLPTASLDDVGKLYILNGTNSAADKLYLIVDTGGNGAGFKEISLT